uniref:NADH dehydrogenase subunit 5 n=1 Tax=Clavisyllis tenjini TaxID=3041283 RepID=UPI002552088F|nr:NADH dehydrogenase subunit 5 [Clavisyllis tenjini]WGF21047.1 NADH dehydrogenase subunit 5 [Clavisyllis tenjini]
MLIKFKSNPLFLAALALFTLSILLLLLSFFLFLNKPMYIMSWELLCVNSSSISIPILLDQWGALFSMTVCFISANIMLFSNSYMKEDKSLTRFSHLVLLFVLSMNFLIFIPSMVILLLGWDLLGIVSFLLVIYYQNKKSLSAGMITALTNRIGDALILISISWTISQGHWLILNMWNSTLYMNNLIILLILLASMTKSAQIPFSSWLPAAMAAPTPVSALVHSSTLVTAGVYLLFRFYPFLSSLPLFNKILTLISSITMLMAGMSAIMEIDMKKIIALSTLSQLGVMMMTLGLGLPYLTFFHLITHALFKALLFICAGGMINLHSHSQDMRNMGNANLQLPIISSSLLIANAALCGAPFLSGFYSKDLIIENSMFLSFNTPIFLIIMLSTMLTSSYSTRLIMSISLNPPYSAPSHPLNDNDKFLSSSILLLTLGAISLGLMMSWFAMAPLQEPFLNSPFKMSIMFVTLMGLIFSYLIYKPSLISLILPISNFPKFTFISTSMWLLAPISSQMLLNFPFQMALKSSHLLDQGWYESMGPKGLIKILSLSSMSLSLLQNNLINKMLFMTMFMVPMFMLT